MTLGEFATLVFRKIQEESPLQLAGQPKFDDTPVGYLAVINKVVAQYIAEAERESIIMDVISRVWASLYQELELSREEVGKLPLETPVPRRTILLADEFLDFPSKLVPQYRPWVIRFEGGVLGPCRPPVSHGLVGIFGSFDAACHWLHENGFEQQEERPDLWQKNSPSAFDYFFYRSEVRVSVGILRAWIEPLPAPQQLNFVSVVA